MIVLLLQQIPLHLWIRCWCDCVGDIFLAHYTPKHRYAMFISPSQNVHVHVFTNTVYTLGQVAVTILDREQQNGLREE